MEAMFTKTVVICVALFFLGFFSDVDHNLAQASEPLNVDTGSPSGNASKSAEENSTTRGEEFYNASCIVCHGPRATGGIGPRLAGNPVLNNDQAFQKIMSEGRHMMPPLADTLTEPQLAGIRAWLRTLR